MSFKNLTDDQISDIIIEHKLRYELKQLSDTEIVQSLMEALTDKYYQKNEYTKLVKSIAREFDGSLTVRQRHIIITHIVRQPFNYM